jgi:hypothetical protein
VIGAGNAAGVVAAAAALKTFSNHTIIDQDCRCELFIGSLLLCDRFLPPARLIHFSQKNTRRDTTKKPWNS